MNGRFGGDEEHCRLGTWREIMRALRIFWPEDVAANGIVIGWMHEEAVVVAAVLDSKVCKALLQKFSNLSFSGRPRIISRTN